VRNATSCPSLCTQAAASFQLLKPESATLEKLRKPNVAGRPKIQRIGIFPFRDIDARRRRLA
jgi:hypothetical protein